MDEINFKHFGFSEEILKSLETLGYKTPTEVQSKVIPILLEGKDIIVKSQTGSGKTATFAIPICEKIELQQRKPQVLILTPTRELAVQVKEDVCNIGRFKRIRCSAIFGKQPIELQQRELRQRVHIIVGTPGRTLDHIERKNIDLEEIKYLVIDEADEMLNMGFIDQMEAIIKKLPRDRITMLFSATIPDRIEEICNQYMTNPEKIEVHSKNPTTEKIQQGYYEVEENEKFSLLNKIIYTEIPESCILFCNTRESVDNLLKKMKDKNYLCSGLHGGMEQRNRLDVIKKFKKGEFYFLIATDVAARGIHIEDISHVINYDIPSEKESYVHRIGRTGRLNSEGAAITFVASNEIRKLNEIEEYIGYKIPKKRLPSEDEINQWKRIFEKNAKVKPKQKNDKNTEFNKEITKIRINVGKKKKMRVGDILGAITKIEGVCAEDIGIIDVQDTCSYVDILGGKGSIVVKAFQHTQIKGKTFSFKVVE